MRVTTWTVPPGILKRDILPKLKADGEAYLQEKNMKLVDSATGKEVDPSTIDWASMTMRKFHYQVVQRPSPDNALGQAKFIFPNRCAVLATLTIRESGVSSSRSNSSPVRAKCPR